MFTSTSTTSSSTITSERTAVIERAVAAAIAAFDAFRNVRDAAAFDSSRVQDIAQAQRQAAWKEWMLARIDLPEELEDAANLAELHIRNADWSIFQSTDQLRAAI